MRPGIAGGSGGFTLIELLLVIAIIGILVGVIAVVGSFDTGRQRAVQNEAERLALAVELARNEALYRNEVWGLAVERDGYRFQRLADTDGSWKDVQRQPFSTRTPDDDISFAVATALKPRATHAGGGAAEEEGGVPAIVIYPGGEITPFEVTVAGSEQLASWIAKSDGIQRTRASREGELEDTDFGGFAELVK